MTLHLPKHTALVFIVVLLCFDTAFSQDAENSSNDLSLELIPTAGTYELDKGYDGETIYKDKYVNFSAVIKNYTDSTIIIAHPKACAPDSSDNPPPWTLEDRIE